MSEIGVTWMQCLAIRADGGSRAANRRAAQALAAVEALENLFPDEILAYAERMGLQSAVDRIRQRGTAAANDAEGSRLGSVSGNYMDRL